MQTRRALFRLPDYADTGVRVANWHENTDANPEELGDYVEGDILYPPTMARNGLKSLSARWPDAVVPYAISARFTMNDFHQQTCVRFKPYSGKESDFLNLTAGKSGCWSSVGRIGGRQDVNLQAPSCVQKKGTVLHELMHALGFLHEHSRYERDDYVEINWKNIKSGKYTNFEKSNRKATFALGVGYDYGSILHYSSRAFSHNGKPTIRSTVKKKLGQREELSSKDIKKIRKMYKCYR
ncbi:unnamed protein product [Trichogramma brassicae]|uniref:Metalloendopeptidase n=1 Tax=Trichogramma brassicae TaxID=86971 RepID=A0A6H5J1K4_9HYME|nr:unnamed protein product [Trichogramma brassicae]